MGNDGTEKARRQRKGQGTDAMQNSNTVNTLPPVPGCPYGFVGMRFSKLIHLRRAWQHDLSVDLTTNLQTYLEK